MSKRQSKSTENIWKKRALSYSEEIKLLRKRNRELSASRDNWKTKKQACSVELKLLRKRNKELCASRDKWQADYKALKTSLPSVPLKQCGVRATKHQYSLEFVGLCLSLYNYGQMSLRSCQYILCCMSKYLNLEHTIPHYTTIRNWICKCGLYRTKISPPQASSYVAYVDESVGFGKERMLLVLGIEEGAIPSGSSVSHKDIDVLYVGASDTWKGENVAEVLDNLEHNISYVVSDEGNNLKKGYELSNYTHIKDITHVLANALKGIYNEDKLFEGFRACIIKLRKKWKQHKQYSKYTPPGMRGQLRFANIFPAVKWANKMLNNWGNLAKDVQQEMSWLKANKAFIDELVQVGELSKMSNKLLKNEGFGNKQKEEILERLKGVCGSARVDRFIVAIKDYLAHLTEQREALGKDMLLCSSDIIESFFGKFKTKVNPNGHSGLTEFMFSIATFGKPLVPEEIQKALESTNCKDLKLGKQPPKEEEKVDEKTERTLVA